MKIVKKNQGQNLDKLKKKLNMLTIEQKTITTKDQLS